MTRKLKLLKARLLRRLHRKGKNGKYNSLVALLLIARFFRRHFLATAQAIAAYAVPDYKAGPQLEYIVEEEKRRNAPKSTNVFVNLASAVAKQFVAGAKNAKENLQKAWKAIYKYCRKTFYRYAQIGVQEEEEEDEHEEDVDLDTLDQKLADLSQKILEESKEAEGDVMLNGLEPFPMISNGEETVSDAVQPFETSIHDTSFTD